MLIQDTCDLLMIQSIARLKLKVLCFRFFVFFINKLAFFINKNMLIIALYTIND